MAVTSIHSIKQSNGLGAIRCITDGDKTVNGLYVQSYACRSDSRGAAEDFQSVRAGGTGRTKILAHRIIQSFKPEEITPEQALQVGEELCNRFLKGDYQYVLSVHTDKDHIHCHIIFNNTNLYNGLSFTTEHNQRKVNERSWAKLQAKIAEAAFYSKDFNDFLQKCSEYGIEYVYKSSNKIRLNKKQQGERSPCCCEM